jgi:hypothetical protein
VYDIIAFLDMKYIVCVMELCYDIVSCYGLYHYITNLFYHSTYTIPLHRLFISLYRFIYTTFLPITSSYDFYYYASTTAPF